MHIVVAPCWLLRTLLLHSSNAQGEFSSLTTVELKKLHAGWHFSNLDGKTFKEKKVELITLDELFERYPDTRINIDIKDNSKEAAQAVAKSIERAAAQSNSHNNEISRLFTGPSMSLNT